jgi:large subunit ribosomal protein L3
MKFLIGKKLNMTQIWQGEDVVAVTKIQTGLCPIVQVKTKEKDGYESVQVGFGVRKEKNIKKPQKGHIKNVKTDLRYLREFRVENGDLKIGDVIDINSFSAGDIIDVIGTSKGKGFQGPVKKYGFHGHNKTHGTKDQVRMPGSIGACGPAHVFKGTRMAGRMGDDRVTVKNLEIAEVDETNNIILIKGAVPGARNGLILIQGDGDLKIKVKSENVKTEEKAEAVEEVKNENREETKEEMKNKEKKEVKEPEAKIEAEVTDKKD